MSRRMAIKSVGSGMCSSFVLKKKIDTATFILNIEQKDGGSSADNDFVYLCSFRTCSSMER